MNKDDTATPSKSNAVTEKQSVAPRKVTPVASSRSVVTPVFVHGTQEEMTVACLPSKLPFLNFDRLSQISLMPRVNAAKRTADLRRPSPFPKISLRKRPSIARPVRNAATTRALELPPREVYDFTSSGEITSPSFCTPRRPNKRRRLSLSPPALPIRCDLFYEKFLDVEQEAVPSRILLPSKGWIVSCSIPSNYKA